MSGAFRTPTYWFLVDEATTTSSIADGAEICVEEIDAVMISSGRVPPLHGAPVASWVLARLAALVRNGSLPTAGQDNDGGAFVLELMAFQHDRSLVAEIQLQGGTEGVSLFGSCISAEDPAKIEGELVDALLAEPSELRSVSLSVRDPDDGSRRRYGFDGTRFYGGGKDTPGTELAGGGHPPVGRRGAE